MKLEETFGDNGCVTVRLDTSADPPLLIATDSVRGNMLTKREAIRLRDTLKLVITILDKEMGDVT